MKNKTQKKSQSKPLKQPAVGRSAYDFKIDALVRLSKYLDTWKNQRTSKMQKSISGSIGNCIKIIINIKD